MWQNGKPDRHCGGNSSPAAQEATTEHRRGLLSLGMVRGMVRIEEKGAWGGRAHRGVPGDSLRTISSHSNLFTAMV